MALPPRKYFSEITLALNTRNALALPPDQLLSGLEISADDQAIIELCHIYAICRRPALSFDPTTFKYDRPFSSGKFVRRIKGVANDHVFRYPLINHAGGRVEVSAYPHRELIGFDEDNEPAVRWPASMISFQADTKDRTINDFEVLYVGQAFGDGTRTAFERLKSHQTLQKILADIHATSPDDEIMLFLFEYEPAKVHIQMDGIAKDAIISGDEDLMHLHSVLDQPLTQREEISIAEAGLIWYFSPSYNIKLKGGHPNDELKLLTSCYNLDMAGLIVEINTEEFPARLWTENRMPGHHHIAQFDLHDPAIRRTFFSLVDGKGKMSILKLSGPVY